MKQLLHIVDNDFKAANKQIFNEPKKNMFRELKENMTLMREQIVTDEK